MAIKTISQFDAATPASNDKILFEQNGEGKSATLADLPVSTKTQTALNTKVNTADVLTIDQIMTSPDLSGKVASAESLKVVGNNLGAFKYFGNTQVASTSTTTIGGFEENKAYLIIDVHYHRAGSMYLTSCGYGLPMKLNHICGENPLELISSTGSSITLKAINNVSSLVILEVGTWG